MVILHDAEPPTAEGRERLKARLREKLNLSSERVEQIFTRLPVILKQDLSAEEAKRYFHALEALGATAERLSQASGDSANSLESIQDTPLPSSAEAANSAEENEGPGSLAEGYSLEELQNMLDAELALAQLESGSEAEALSLSEGPIVEQAASFLDSASPATSAAISTEEVSKSGESFPELSLAPTTDETPATETQLERRLDGELSFDDEAGAEQDFAGSLGAEDAEVEFLIDPTEQLQQETSEDTTPQSESADMMLEIELHSSDSADPEHEAALLERLEQALPRDEPESNTEPEVISKPEQEVPTLPTAHSPATPVSPYSAQSAGVPTRKIEAASRLTVWAGIAVLAFGVGVLLLKPELFSDSNDAQAGLQIKASPEMIDALLKQQEEILGTTRPKRTGVDAREVSEFKGSEEVEGVLSYTTTMLSVNEIPAYMDLEVRTPEPSPLTAEELVAGKRRPWVRRVVASGLRLDTSENEEERKTAIAADGTARLSGNARVYLQDREFRDRLVARVTVSARVTDASVSVGQFEISIGNNHTDSPALVEKEQVVYVEHLKDHGFQVFIKSPFKAGPVAEVGADEGKK